MEERHDREIKSIGKGWIELEKIVGDRWWWRHDIDNLHHAHQG